MTLSQLETLTEDELGLILYVVNTLDPVKVPPIQFEPKHLVWFKHDALIQKILKIFPQLKEEGHAIYSSLLTKLGVQHEIKKQANHQPAPLVETTGSLDSCISGSATSGSL